MTFGTFQPFFFTPFRCFSEGPLPKQCEKSFMIRFRCAIHSGKYFDGTSNIRKEEILAGAMNLEQIDSLQAKKSFSNRFWSSVKICCRNFSQFVKSSTYRNLTIPQDLSPSHLNSYAINFSHIFPANL